MAHPAPWKIQIVGNSAHVIDAERDTVTAFAPDDAEFWQYICKAVNNHEQMVQTLEALRDDPAVPAWIQTLATGSLSRVGNARNPSNGD